MRPTLPAGALTLAFLLSISARPAAQAQPSWTERVKPYRVIGNIYYVGTKDLSSFLVTSDQGHVLIDTGLEARRALPPCPVRTGPRRA